MCAESADSRDDWIRELVGERDRCQGKKNGTAAVAVSLIFCYEFFVGF